MADRVKGTRGLVIPNLLTAVARTIVRVGQSGYARRAIRFIAGTNVTLGIADDAENEEVEVTINASGGGGSPGDSVTSETSYGQAASAGASASFSRADHTHGTPALPDHANLPAGLAWPGSGHTGTARGVPNFSGAGAAQTLSPPSANASDYVLGWDGTTLAWVTRTHGLVFGVGLYDVVAYGPTHYAGLTGTLV